MITIRLRRIGKKKTPIYNLVLAEHTAPIKGKFIEKLGLFNSKAKDENQRLSVNDERVKYWISKGAQTSQTVNNLLVDAKVLEEKDRIKASSTKKKREKEEKPEKPAEISTATEPKKDEGESIIEEVIKEEPAETQTDEEKIKSTEIPKETKTETIESPTDQKPEPAQETKSVKDGKPEKADKPKK